MSTANNNANDAATSMPPPLIPGQRKQTYRPVDCVSVVSDSSVHGGAMDPISVTLRGLRKVLRTARNTYMAALKNADTLDEDNLLDYQQDMDALCIELWLAVWRLVSIAKMYAELASNQDKATSLLSTTESSLTEVRKLWDLSYYFDKNTYASHI